METRPRVSVDIERGLLTVHQQLIPVRSLALLQMPVQWVAQLQMEMLACAEPTSSCLLVSRSAAKVASDLSSGSGVQDLQMIGVILLWHA